MPFDSNKFNKLCLLVFNQFWIWKRDVNRQE
jgi:hypothetical protein